MISEAEDSIVDEVVKAGIQGQKGLFTSGHESQVESDARIEGGVAIVAMIKRAKESSIPKDEAIEVNDEIYAEPTQPMTDSDQIKVIVWKFIEAYLVRSKDIKRDMATDVYTKIRAYALREHNALLADNKATNHLLGRYMESGCVAYHNTPVKYVASCKKRPGVAYRGVTFRK